MAEIDDAELNTLQRGFALLQKLSTSPKTQRDFERVLKMDNPELQTTEDLASTVAKPYLDKVEDISKRLEERFAAMDEREAKSKDAQEQRETEEAFSRLRQAGYQDDGLDRIKQLMVERRIADPEAAAALFDRQNPKVDTRPSAWEPDSWNYHENAVDNDMEGLLKNPDKWADKQVAIVLNEMRRGEH